MNAPARDLSVAANVSKAIARDLFGFDTLPPSATTDHLMLSALDTEGGLGLLDSTWPAGTHLPRHRHDIKDEILIVVSGMLEVRIGERILRRGPGEAAFIPRGVEHEVTALTEVRHIAILTAKSLESPRPN